MAILLAPMKDLVDYLTKNVDISKSKKGKLLKIILSIIQEFITASPITRQMLNSYNIAGLLIKLI